MKKKLFLLFVCFQGLSAGSIQQLCEPFRLFSAEITSFVTGKHHISLFGDERVSKKAERVVFDILHNMGISTKDIFVRQMNDYARQYCDSDAAFVWYNMIFIDEKHFLKLPSAEQAFLIGHEGMHIVHQDRKKSLFVFLASVVTEILLFKRMLKGKKRLSGMTPIKIVGTMFLSHYVLMYYNRWQEKQADIGACQRLKTIKGAIGLCEKWLAYEESNALSMWDRCVSFFDTHPSFKQRIKYIQDLKNWNE